MNKNVTRMAVLVFATGFSGASLKVTVPKAAQKGAKPKSGIQLFSTPTTPGNIASIMLAESSASLLAQYKRAWKSEQLFLRVNISEA